MGIRGLTGFIDQNQRLLQEHELRCCSVVIDGNNFYHYLYQACHVHSTFGGDYDVYKANVESTFESMKECGIKPFIVLDGAYTVDGRKLRTSLSRAVNRIKLVDSVTNGYEGHALPVLAYETFVQVLVDLKIPHAMCQFEADSEIATLANQLQCPVISNDSDFYIFDLAFGFLPLDYIDFRPIHKRNENGDTAYLYLHSHKYHVDNFISSFNLGRSTLPIIATLLGNDFIDASNFSSFYAKFKVPKVESKKFSLPPKMTKVISVLHWLHTQADDKGITYLKDEILNYIPPNKTNIVGKLFDKAVAGYTEVDMFDGFNLFKFFTDDISCAVHESSDFCCYNNKPFPSWFVQAVCKGELTSHILNAAILHRVILLTQMESLASESAYNASSFLRKVLYTILLKDDQYDFACSSVKGTSILASKPQQVEAAKEFFTCDAAFGLKEILGDEKGQENNVSLEKTIICNDEKDERVGIESEEKIVNQEILLDGDIKESSESWSGRNHWNSNIVEEYTRVTKQLKKNVIDPFSETKTCTNLPGLKMINTMEPDKKVEIMCQVFSVKPSCLKYFPDKLKVFCLCVIAWIRFCQPKVTFSQLDSLILTMVYLTTKRELKARKRKQKPEEEVENCPKAACSNSYNPDDSEKCDVELVCQKCSSANLKSFSTNLERHHKTAPTFNRAHIFNTSYCHAFAQLQAIVVDTCHLTRLLQQPLPIPRPADLINGTLLYNLTTELSSRPNPELFVSMMFSTKDVVSPLRDLYKNVRQFFHEEMSLAPFLSLPPQVNGKNKKKRKKTKEKQLATCEETEGGKEDEGAPSQEEEGMSDFAASNKFSLLLLCDD